MSFANQALAAEFLAETKGTLEKKVYAVPADIDQEIARLKLDSMGIQIDTLTDVQKKYLNSVGDGDLRDALNSKGLKFPPPFSVPLLFRGRGAF